MIERIITNTSPLLAIAKMQAFEVIGNLPFEFVCPSEVEAEILVGANQGYAVEIPAWLNVLSLNSALSPLAVAALDAGEAAVIQLALEQNIKLVLYRRTQRQTRCFSRRFARCRLARTAR